MDPNHLLHHLPHMVLDEGQPEHALPADDLGLQGHPFDPLPDDGAPPEAAPPGTLRVPTITGTNQCCLCGAMFARKGMPSTPSCVPKRSSMPMFAALGVILFPRQGRICVSHIEDAQLRRCTWDYGRLRKKRDSQGNPVQMFRLATPDDVCHMVLEGNLIEAAANADVHGQTLPSDDVAQLKQRIADLEAELEDVRKTPPLETAMQKSDVLTQTLTGAPSFRCLEELLALLEPHLDSTSLFFATHAKTESTRRSRRPRKISGMERVILMCMRLRLFLPYSALAPLFGLSETYAVNMCLSTMQCMAVHVAPRVVRFPASADEARLHASPSLSGVGGLVQLFAQSTNRTTMGSVRRALCEADSGRHFVQMAAVTGPDGYIYAIEGPFGGATTATECLRRVAESPGAQALGALARSAPDPGFGTFRISSQEIQLKMLPTCSMIYHCVASLCNLWYKPGAPASDAVALVDLEPQPRAMPKPGDLVMLATNHPEQQHLRAFSVVADPHVLGTIEPGFLVVDFAPVREISRSVRDMALPRRLREQEATVGHVLAGTGVCVWPVALTFAL